MLLRISPHLLPEVERAQARARLEEQDAGDVIRLRLALLDPHLLEQLQRILGPPVFRVAGDQNVPRDRIAHRHFVEQPARGVPVAAVRVAPQQRGGEEGVADVALGEGVGVELARVGRCAARLEEDGEREGVPAAAERAHAAEKAERVGGVGESAEDGVALEGGGEQGGWGGEVVVEDRERAVGREGGGREAEECGGGGGGGRGGRGGGEGEDARAEEVRVELGEAARGEGRGGGEERGGDGGGGGGRRGGT